MAEAAAVVRVASNTAKMSRAVRTMWDNRTKTRVTMNDGTAQDLVVRAQIDEIFLVLAHLGEAILPLGVFNKDYYMQALGEVQASISSCGNEFLPMAWAELDAELQYVCTAALAFCATFAPLHVYRGFGACVFGDWDWGCPDLAYLDEKAKKKAVRTIYGFKQKIDPPATRSAFTAFDQAIQILQVKPMAFLTKKPTSSGFADKQPRYGAKPKREVKDEHELLEDWVKQLEKRGHPAPSGGKLSSWGFPFATYTSPYNCHILKTEKDCETIAYYQMDTGRLLHAFVCRGSATLDEGQIFLLSPRSPAESLMCWLEGLPGTTHKIIKWQDLDTEYFEKKISKSLRKKIGVYPLPVQYAIRDPEAAKRPSMSTATSSPTLLEHPNTVSPPPYSRQLSTTPAIPELHDEESRPAVAELGSPGPREMPGSFTYPPIGHQSSSVPTRGATTNERSQTTGLGVSSGLKSIHHLRRKPTPTAVATTSGSPPIAETYEPTTSNAAPSNGVVSSVPNTVELPAETAIQDKSEAEQHPAIELPTEFQAEAPRPLVTKKSNLTQEPDRMTQEPDTMQSSDPAQALQGAQDQSTVTKAEDPTHAAAAEPLSEHAPLKEDENTEAPKLGDLDVARSVDAQSQYLDLLNKVAKGEISPQALGEMLQKGHIAQQSISLSHSVPVEGEAAKDFTAPTSASKSPLPYPATPTDGKSGLQENVATSEPLPYPVTPTNREADSQTNRTPSNQELPLSLRPGAS